MIYSEFGKIAEEEWHRSFELRDELFLHAYIIMPNHIHALIGVKHPIDREINEIHTAGAHDIDGGQGDHVDTHGRAYQSEPPPHEQTNGRAYQSEPPPHEQTDGRANRRAGNSPAEGRSRERKFTRKPKSISSFVAGFKSVVVTRIDDYIDENQLNVRKFNRRYKFWQDNYHDRVIKDDTDYWNVKRYIVRNPQDWNEDEFFLR